MSDLFIDFETASDLDVTEVGAYKYASDPSTFVRCLSWAINDGPVCIWTPGAPMPDNLKDALNQCLVHAWNAQFERLIFEYCMPDSLPSPTFNQWRCTAAHARANALPGSLAKAAKVLDLGEMKGDTRLMKKLSKAGYLPTYAEMVALHTYCIQDTIVERLIYKTLPPISDDEVFVFQLNERINDRGMLIDKPFVTKMTEILAEETNKLNRKLYRITRGAVAKFTQVARIKACIRHEGSLDAPAIEKLLADPDYPQLYREILEIRQLGAKSSTAKYKVMLKAAMDDDRLRGMFVFAGAGQTGRFSSRLVQLHNLVRKVPADAADRIHDVQRLPTKIYKRLHGSDMLNQASQLIRPALIAPPGKTFVIGDFSSVEAKGVPWLAGHTEEVNEWAAGADKYVDDAIDVFNLPRDQITDWHRQAGKVVRLACGFGGKAGALLQMAKGYGLELTEDEAKQMADAWHAANPWVVEFAKTLSLAALSAVRFPGIVAGAGEKIKYCSEYIGDQQVLRCQLPSGRVISYQDVKIEDSEYGPQLSSVKPRESFRERLWHGLHLENVDQAMCNDLLRYAMVNLDLAGFDVVAHIHDETVEEVSENEAKQLVPVIKGIMERRPAWAVDFPLVAKVHASKRYTK